MACGRCGTKNVANKKFIYTSPSGETEIVKTELEARARQIRKGGTYKAAPQ